MDQKTFIISTPDMKMLELDGNEEFLILACDGLWDDISPESAANIVRRQVVADPGELKRLNTFKEKNCSCNFKNCFQLMCQPLARS